MSASRAAVGTWSCPGHSSPGEGLWAAEGGVGDALLFLNTTERGCMSQTEIRNIYSVGPLTLRPSCSHLSFFPCLPIQPVVNYNEYLLPLSPQKLSSVTVKTVRSHRTQVCYVLYHFVPTSDLELHILVVPPDTPCMGPVSRGLRLSVLLQNDCQVAWGLGGGSVGR